MPVHIQLNCKNDTNGNPRRISLLLESEEIKDVRDHGYRGHPREWGSPLTTIDVPPSEYRYWKNYKRDERIAR